MFKLSVALLLVALALTASARPSLISQRTVKQARLLHNELQNKEAGVSVFNSEGHIHKRHAEVKRVDFDDVESSLVKYLIDDLKWDMLHAADPQDRAKYREILAKYPDPDYRDSRAVNEYLDNLLREIKAYKASRGIW